MQVALVTWRRRRAHHAGPFAWPVLLTRPSFFVRLPRTSTPRHLQLAFAAGTEYAGEFLDGMNSGFGVLKFPDNVRDSPLRF